MVGNGDQEKINFSFYRLFRNSQDDIGKKQDDTNANESNISRKIRHRHNA